MLVSGLRVCVGNKSHLPQDTFPNGFSSFRCFLELRHLSLSGISTITTGCFQPSALEPSDVFAVLHPSRNTFNWLISRSHGCHWNRLFRGTSRVRGLSWFWGVVSSAPCNGSAPVWIITCFLYMCECWHICNRSAPKAFCSFSYESSWSWWVLLLLLPLFLFVWVGFFFSTQGTESRASCMSIKHSPSELYLQSLKFFDYNSTTHRT